MEDFMYDYELIDAEEVNLFDELDREHGDWIVDPDMGDH